MNHVEWCRRLSEMDSRQLEIVLGQVMALIVEKAKMERVDGNKNKTLISAIDFQTQRAIVTT